MSTANRPVFELRVALTSRDFERSVKFYSEGLGIEPAALWNNDGGRAMMLDLGHASLELFDEKQAETLIARRDYQALSWSTRLSPPRGVTSTSGCRIPMEYRSRSSKRLRGVRKE